MCICINDWLINSFSCLPDRHLLLTVKNLDSIEGMALGGISNFICRLTYMSLRVVLHEQNLTKCQI